MKLAKNIKKNKRHSRVRSTSSLLSQRKAVSEVVGTVIIVAITIGVAAVVWIVINNFVKSETESAGSCLEIFEKVSLEGRYTCYNSISDELQFSISIADIEVDEVLIGISGEGTGISFTIRKQPGAVDNVVMYPNRDVNARLPGKNAGLTYLFNLSAAGFTEVPQTIQISPVIGGNQCEVSDSLSGIENCAAFAP